MNRFLFRVILAGLIANNAIGQGLHLVTDTDELRGTNWYFKSGDNKRWADSAFNDRSWESVSIDADIEIKSDTWQTTKGWFRHAIRPRPGVVNKSLRLAIKQFGASEIYLDGRLLAVLKPPQFDSGGSQRLVRFVPIQFSDTNRHVLAIRYQFRRDPIIQASTTIVPINIHLYDTDLVGGILLDEAEWTSMLDGCFIGVFGMLALLHFLFYRANKSQPINRLLAWDMLFFAGVFIMIQLDEFVGTLTYVSITDLISDLSIHIGFILLLTAVYQYLHLPRRWPYYGVVCILLVDQLYRIGLGIPPTGLAWIPFSLIILDYIRVSWLARKTKDADARLPWNSLKTALYCFLLVFVVAIISGILESAVDNAIEYFLVLVIPLVAIALFSIPVGLSLSLVRDYTRTHKALGDNLREVEQLSARTLAQEQEKQHILARQNEVLEEQVKKRTVELHQSLDELRSTQAQLVQREKLASLGELTAGIAHEIQNPLNFVNNFAEVSVELIEELTDERQKSSDQRDEALEVELLGDLSQNVQKISDHGKRAASIVRGMLQHSRNSSGQKQPTDLNALVDEYLRLAYQGLRAKDKSFNAHLITNFSSDLPAINIVPEDVGRVLVNLFNNAFYAVQQKSQSGSPSFAPTVSVQTALDKTQLIIRVRDNGAGIPDNVRDKVFQPFFTTKPTGQGTGLGLSLSYDIITKGHGGSLNVETEPGEFTEFTIILPVKYKPHSN